MDIKTIALLGVAAALVFFPEPITTATGTTIGLAALAGMLGMSGMV